MNQYPQGLSRKSSRRGENPTDIPILDCLEGREDPGAMDLFPRRRRKIGHPSSSIPLLQIFIQCQLSKKNIKYTCRIESVLLLTQTRAKSIAPMYVGTQSGQNSTHSHFLLLSSWLSSKPPPRQSERKEEGERRKINDAKMTASYSWSVVHITRLGEKDLRFFSVLRIIF